MTLIPATSHVGGATPFPKYAGIGTPTGVQVGSVGDSYVDTTNGALYWKASGAATNTGWIMAGHAAEAGVGEAGLFIFHGSDGDRVHLMARSVTGLGGSVNIGDLVGFAGTGNGLEYLSGAADGQQTLALFLGSSSQFVTRWNADGTCTLAAAAGHVNDAVRLNQVSPLLTVTSGALSTQQLVSTTGAQISTTRDVETVTPVTFNPGAATTATCLVQLSPDNVTYSTLGTETEPVGVAFDGTIHLIKVRVPAGWYLKLTVNAQATLGVTTYY
jgi:hypothetical protein